MNNGQKQAFPLTTDADRDTEMHEGISKREYFAGLAMQGIMASMGQVSSHPSEYGIGKLAVAVADDLLSELEKPQS